MCKHRLPYDNQNEPQQMYLPFHPTCILCIAPQNTVVQHNCNRGESFNTKLVLFCRQKTSKSGNKSKPARVFQLWWVVVHQPKLSFASSCKSWSRKKGWKKVWKRKRMESGNLRHHQRTTKHFYNYNSPTRMQTHSKSMNWQQSNFYILRLWIQITEIDGPLKN